MRIRSPKDFWSGLFFIAVAVGFIGLSHQYGTGTLHRMGPGLFPTLVGVLLVGLGLIIALRAFAIDGPPVPRFHARPIIVSLVAIALFGVALAWQNIVYCFIGCFLGTLVGVLPGIGPVATVAMLLPFTFNLGPAPALIMLAGIYYGAQYGGSTTAILVNIPGETSSVVTTLDGYQMARRGRAGPALGIAAIGSFIAGCIATLVIAYFAPPLAELALKFSPAAL